MKRAYSYYDYTQSLCSECLELVSAKIVFEDGRVNMHKNCPQHGREVVCVSTDIEYYKKTREFIKPGDLPQKFLTPVKYGCPYDCGLCPDHEQHSCLTIIEITDRCNLKCPTCYAQSAPDYGRHRTFDEVRAMFEALLVTEKEPDIVQISGGEPTLHPDFFKILDYAKTLPIRHLMVNTNGVKIARDRDFAKKLASYKPGFEVYLQFDSLNPEPLLKLRGEDLRDVRKDAIAILNELNISTTLVVTLSRDHNLNEIGEILAYAKSQKCVRGVTFQPIQYAGRTDDVDPLTQKISLSEVRQEILKQSDFFAPQDLIPVPCNPDALAMAYALKIDGEFFPLSRFVDPELLLRDGKNTIVYETDPQMKQKAIELFSTALGEKNMSAKLQSLLCCLPQIEAPQISYDQVFRVIIMQFMDAYNFDVRAVKRSCVHIIDKQGRVIPFENMNLFYRDDKIERLKQIQKKREVYV